MTEKKYRETILKLGGSISDPSCCVDFPDNFRISNKSEALAVLDILMLTVHGDREYSVSFDEPLKALRTAIKKGLV